MVLTILSCSQQQDCNNGQQDSGETGVDCGGVCPPCPIINMQPPPPTTTCSNSTWKYELILATPSNGGDIWINYRDETSMNTYTKFYLSSGSTTWTRTFTFPPVGQLLAWYHHVFVDIQGYPIGSNRINTGTLNIYRDGVIVATMGPTLLCDGPNPCAANTFPSFDVNYACNN